MAVGASAGCFRSGLPYNRFGHGPRPLVIFQGLMFENKPLDGPMVRFYSGMYGSLKDDFTTYLVTRRPGLPAGCSMKDMSDDYAVMIREEFEGRPMSPASRPGAPWSSTSPPTIPTWSTGWSSTRAPTP